MPLHETLYIPLSACVRGSGQSAGPGNLRHPPRRQADAPPGFRQGQALRRQAGDDVQPFIPAPVVGRPGFRLVSFHGLVGLAGLYRSLFGIQIVRDLPSNRRIALRAEESGGDCAGASYRTYVRKSISTCPGCLYWGKV